MVGYIGNYESHGSAFLDFEIVKMVIYVKKFNNSKK